MFIFPVPGVKPSINLGPGTDDCLLIYTRMSDFANYFVKFTRFLAFCPIFFDIKFYVCDEKYVFCQSGKVTSNAGIITPLQQLQLLGFNVSLHANFTAKKRERKLKKHG